jgi:hypothetical protein
MAMSEETAQEEPEVVTGTPEARREQAVRSVKNRRDFQTHVVAFRRPISEEDISRELDRLGSRTP